MYFSPNQDVFVTLTYCYFGEPNQEVMNVLQ